MPYLSRIFLFPIKSLDGVEVSSATLLPGGALRGDREFALVDDQGRFVNGKRTEQIHRIRSEFDLEARTVTLGVEGEYQRLMFHLDAERADLEAWFSDYFGYPVFLQQNSEQGFPDDTDASGPTVISEETLAVVAAWFPPLTVADIRRRFRTNLELEDAPAFWEDQLFGAAGTVVPFQVGEATLLGNNPCQRCVVVTRDARTGDRWSHFQNRFVAQRSHTLPAWTPAARFNHYFRLAVNTQVAATEAGKRLRVGDRVSL